MLTTKEQFDSHMMATINRVRESMALNEIHADLLSQFNMGKAPELKFLDEMPFEMSKEYVRHTLTQYHNLHMEYPEQYPIVAPREVIAKMREFKKNLRKLRKACPIKEPTGSQRAWIESLGLHYEDWLVKSWDSPVIELVHRITGEVRQLSKFGEEEI